MSNTPRRPKKKQQHTQVWGPSVDHDSYCAKRRDGGHEDSPCTCPKKNYCDKCDAQHPRGNCPRTVLDDIVDQLNHDDKSLKTLVNEILEAAEARRSWNGTMKEHIDSRIDELAARYGNLGISRKNLRVEAIKELRRRERREFRDTLKERHGKLPKWWRR